MSRTQKLSHTSNCLLHPSVLLEGKVKGKDPLSFSFCNIFFILINSLRSRGMKTETALHANGRCILFLRCSATAAEPALTRVQDGTKIRRTVSVNFNWILYSDVAWVALINSCLCARFFIHRESPYQTIYLASLTTKGFINSAEDGRTLLKQRHSKMPMLKYH